jgi:hypothetical protein
MPCALTISVPSVPHPRCNLLYLLKITNHQSLFPLPNRQSPTPSKKNIGQLFFQVLS